MDVSVKVSDSLCNCFRNKDFLFCIVYGSSAYHLERSHSDIDIMVAVRQLDPSYQQEVISSIIDLHRENGLDLDEEVPFENKAVVSLGDVLEAIQGQCFKENKGDKVEYRVGSVVKSRQWLSSKEIRLRLILSALTTNPVFVSGNIILFDILRRAAIDTMINLIFWIGKRPLSELELVNALITDGKCEGEMYLGYKNHPVIRQCLRAGFGSRLRHMVQEGKAFYANGKFFVEPTFHQKMPPSLEKWLADSVG